MIQTTKKTNQDFIMLLKVIDHTVSCTSCTSSGQFSAGAGIQPLAVRRLFNGLDAVTVSTRWV